MNELKPKSIFFTQTAYGVLFDNGTCLPYGKVISEAGRSKAMARTVSSKLGLSLKELAGTLPPLNFEAAVLGKCAFVEPALPLPPAHPHSRISISQMAAWATDRGYDETNGTLYASSEVIAGLTNATGTGYVVVKVDDGTLMAVTVKQAYEAHKRECLTGFKLHTKNPAKSFA